MNKSPKICLYDLEVSREVVEGYRQKYDFKVVKTIRHQELMCYAWKDLGSKKIHYVSRHHFKKYKDFVQSLADMLNESDISIAHNARGFDDKMSNTFFIKEGVDVPSPRKSIDTLQVARSVFRFPGNSLNQLCEYLGIGSKEKITYADIETEFMSNPTRKIERQMAKYNKKDVELLEKVYERLRPYMKNHPLINTYSGNAFSCPKCGGSNLQKRGFAYTATAVYQQYACLTENCGAWSRERTQDKSFTKPRIVNI